MSLGSSDQVTLNDEFQGHRVKINVFNVMWPLTLTSSTKCLFGVGVKGSKVYLGPLKIHFFNKNRNESLNTGAVLTRLLTLRQSFLLPFPIHLSSRDHINRIYNTFKRCLIWQNITKRLWLLKINGKQMYLEYTVSWRCTSTHPLYTRDWPKA